MTAPFHGHDRDLLALSDLLSNQGRFGVAWLDLDLVVTRTYGAITVGVAIGEPISSSVLALIGQEEQIVALTSAERPSFTMANVAVVDGEGAPVRITLHVLFDRKLGYVVVFDRVMAASLSDLMVDDEIRKRRIADAELARINKQLEEFAYVISHDLKAPLRALRYYSGDVGEALQADPPDLDTARLAADNIVLATKRMSSMLVGLLEYSRSGRQHEAIETVDSAALVQDIVSNLPRPEGIRIAIEGEWPTLRTTPVPLDLVLRNLIDNAVKHHDRPTGLIRLTGEDKGSTLRLQVIDDGPGIAPEWHEAIFLPFSRVDDHRHPDSSGIGLALVKRATETAGGRIEVLSDPAKGRGTIFRVVWPKR